MEIYNDHYHERIILEYEARILIRQGKLDDSIKKFEEALGISKKYNHSDNGLIILLGDYSEVLKERGHYQ